MDTSKSDLVTFFVRKQIQTSEFVRLILFGNGKDGKMPKFGSVLSSLQSKIEEARISDLNYELGKFVQDTKCYFSSAFKGNSATLRPSSVPKSTSLPLFPAAARFKSTSDDFSVEPITGKYKYRSSFRPPSDEDILGSVDIIEEEEEPVTDSTVVEKFVRVIESSSGFTKSSNTREDIRRKLAFGKPEKKALANDLEVCFINEIEEDDISEYHIPPSLTRSQSECVSIVAKVDKDETTVGKLLRCKQDARRKMMLEKRNRNFIEVNSFNKLIGRSIEGKLNQEILSQMNTATIQVIFNHFHNKIENLNEELVKELIKKDELQIEQDGQLVDIDDLTQALSKCKSPAKS